MKKPHVLLDPANFWLWLTPALLIAIAGGLGTELVKNPEDGRMWMWLGLIVGAVVVMGLLFSQKVRRMIAEQRRGATLRLSRTVTRAKALVVFVSMPPGSSSAVEAALYHGDKDVLRELWMITSEQAAGEAKRVGEVVKARYPSVTVNPAVCVGDAYSIENAKDEVEKIRKVCLRKYRDPAEVMCDFTGFTKSMSAGMILACAPRQARLQYMHPNEIFPDGRANSAAGSHPVEVELAYWIEEDEL